MVEDEIGVGRDNLGQLVFKDEIVLCLFKSWIRFAPATICFEGSDVILKPVTIPVVSSYMDSARFIKPPLPILVDPIDEGDVVVIHNFRAKTLEITTVQSFHVTANFYAHGRLCDTPVGQFYENSIFKLDVSSLLGEFSNLPSKWLLELVKFSNGQSVVSLKDIQLLS